MQPSCLALALPFALALALAGAAGSPPPTPKKPVTDTYNGVQVVDDYRWLENYSDPAVRQWSDQAKRVCPRLPGSSAGARGPL
jgi:prolyl oligopeptidase